jgi:hypothetical protein
MILLPSFFTAFFCYFAGFALLVGFIIAITSSYFIINISLFSSLYILMIFLRFHVGSSANATFFHAHIDIAASFSMSFLSFIDYSLGWLHYYIFAD